MPLSSKKVRSGYIIAFLLLIISYFLIFFIVKKVVAETDNVGHSYTVINKLEIIRAEILDAETGLRGYLLTKDPRFLRSYSTGIANVPVAAKQLQSLVQDNPHQTELLDTMNVYIDQRLALMSRALRLFQDSNFQVTAEMRKTREISKKAMDTIKSIVEQMSDHEQVLMNTRKVKLGRFFTGARIIAVASLITALLTILYSLLIYTREKRDKEKSNEKVKQYSEELQANIVELKEANAELDELRRMEKFAATGRIARTIAHEVRNPLTNISLATEQLQENASNSEEASMLLAMISRNSSRINQLVADLLNATRFAQLEVKQADMSVLLEETLVQARDRIELNQIRLIKNYSATPCMVDVDEEKMKLALLNIIVNAIEAMEKGKGVLELTTRLQADKCVIEVKDNGSGMDKDTVHKLFEPYFTGKQKGNGLGLTNTQNIILNHKGNIHVISSPGQGSTFMIYLSIAGKV